MCCDHCPVVWLFYPSFRCQTDSLSSYLTSSLAYRQIHGWLNDWKVPCSHKTNLNPPLLKMAAHMLERQQVVLPQKGNSLQAVEREMQTIPPSVSRLTDFSLQLQFVCSPPANSSCTAAASPGWHRFSSRMGMCSFVWGGTGWALQVIYVHIFDKIARHRPLKHSKILNKGDMGV